MLWEPKTESDRTMEFIALLFLGGLALNFFIRAAIGLIRYFAQ